MTIQKTTPGTGGNYYKDEDGNIWPADEQGNPLTDDPIPLDKDYVRPPELQ